MRSDTFGPLPHYARKRDDCERAIVRALVAAGATVARLDGRGLPDLLVGRLGVTYLLECKDAHGKDRIGGKRTESGLRDSQAAWWQQWRGAPPVIVTCPAEALAALGL